MSELLKLDVSAHTEKKGQLTYLSWAWAWAEVLKIDPQATWEVCEFNGLPIVVLPDTSAMVKVVVTINNHTKSCWLPVMDHKNKAIKGPDAFSINTAIMRCMTKAVSMHGLGLYIYGGEDLPEGAERPDTKTHGVAKDFSASGPKLAFEALNAEWQAYLQGQAVLIENGFEQFGASRAIDMITELELDSDQRAGLEYLLGSKTRSGMKKAEAETKA
jgi:Protein of unknown function (DUF1071)